MLLNTLSYSAHFWLVSVSIFLFCFCSTPRVGMHVVDLCRSQTMPLGFAQHIELICLLLTCLDSRDSLFQHFVLCVETSTRPASCSVVSHSYLNTLTFVRLVLVSSCFIHPSFWVFDLFLIALNSVCLAAFCTFVIAFLKHLPSTQPHAVAKRTVVDAYKYIN